MRTFAAALFVSLAGANAHADLLWDNFITQPAGYDNLTARSSERNTIVTASWTGDDAVFDHPVAVQSLEWIGFRTPGVAFNAADVIILDDAFSQIALYQNLPYSANLITMRQFNLETVNVYDGTVQIPSTNLANGHYFYAVRLVDSGLGRNYVATTGNGVLNGLSSGVFQSAQFGFPNWTPVSQFTTPTDYAYRLFGVPIPEPGSFTLLAGAALLMRRR